MLAHSNSVPAFGFCYSCFTISPRPRYPHDNLCPVPACLLRDSQFCLSSDASVFVPAVKHSTLARSWLRSTIALRSFMKQATCFIVSHPSFTRVVRFHARALSPQTFFPVIYPQENSSHEKGQNGKASSCIAVTPPVKIAHRLRNRDISPQALVLPGTREKGTRELFSLRVSDERRYRKFMYIFCA